MNFILLSYNLCCSFGKSFILIVILTYIIHVLLSKGGTWGSRVAMALSPFLKFQRTPFILINIISLHIVFDLFFTTTPPPEKKNPKKTIYINIISSNIVFDSSKNFVFSQMAPAHFPVPPRLVSGFKLTKFNIYVLLYYTSKMHNI